MSNAGSFGKRNWITEGNDDLTGVATSSVILPAASNVTFGDPVNDTTDHHIPRFMVANATGTLITTGWHADDVPVTRNVTAGQIIHYRPKAITGGSAEVILEY